MSTLKHLVIAVCLLAGPLFHAAAGIAGDKAEGQMIGLCYRDGSKGMVLEEILKTEGVPHVRLRDLSQLGKLGLGGLILGGGFDSSVRELNRFVEKGGVLLSIQPSGRLAEALGLKEVGVRKDGYLAVRGKSAAAISHEGRFQLFGQSKCFQGGESLAWLSPAEKFGGIIRVRHGSGTALVVAFDLATTFMKFQQPESPCGKHIDASNVEYDLGHVPQVDLIRGLLLGLFLESLDVPVLRKWYFPSQCRGLLIVQGDQDGADFEQLKVVLSLIKEVETPYTLFILQGRRPVTKEQFRVLAEGGMDFALHPNFFKADGIKFREEELVAQLRKAEADVGRAITGERPHSGRWDSVRELPMWDERAGLQYNTILGQKWWELGSNKVPKDGYWIGTGLPYHFIDPDNYRRIDVLEIPIFNCDNRDFWKKREYSVRYKPGAHKMFDSGPGLTENEAFERWKLFLNRAIEKYPTAYGYNWHPAYLAAKSLNFRNRYPTDTHFRKCIRHARSRGLGLMSTNGWNDFWRSREKVALADVAWCPESCTAKYRVSSKVKLDSLTLIAPLVFKGKKALISVGGSPKYYVQADLAGCQYAMFTVDAGPEELLVTVKYD